MIATLRERFEMSYQPEPNTGCFLWTGMLDKSGYGRIHGDTRNHSLLAHRAAYLLHVGPLTRDLCVCHRCDVRCCVNPAHLFLGTRTDNHNDMVLKGRLLRGKQLPQTKLTDDDVRAIRADGRLQEVIAAEYGVGSSLVSRIKNRVKRGDVP